MGSTESKPAAAFQPAPDSFDHQPRTRLVFGPGSVSKVGLLARETGMSRVLLVTDPGIVAAGHAQRVQNCLNEVGVTTVLYDRVRENPSTVDVDDCLKAAREAAIDGFIGLGGGSSMDTAKGCNFLLTNGGKMEDYWGIGKARLPMLPLIAIPTTAGTGSECQSFAIISQEETHNKMACGDPKAAARIAILDPSLTISQPPRVTACTGIDALAHALETAVTTRRNPLSMLFSHKAFDLCINNLGKVWKNPVDVEARGKMLLGAAFAGTAIENSMLGAVHAAANPLTAHFSIVHGEAVGLMLPHVIRFNAQIPAVAEAYAELALGGGIVFQKETAGDAVRALIASVENLLELVGLTADLNRFGITEAEIPMLAAEAAKQWTGNFNPRPVTATDFQAIYRAALNTP